FHACSSCRSNCRVSDDEGGGGRHAPEGAGGGCPRLRCGGARFSHAGPHLSRADIAVDYQPSEIIVPAGGKQALFNAVMALFGPGDEVITHMPGWPTLVEQIKLAEATPVLVRTYAENGFQLKAEPFLNAMP